VPEDEVVRELTELVWNTVLGLEVQCVATEDPPTDLVTSVDIDGAWRGRVTVRLSWEIARVAASQMLACPAEAASREDVKDAAGELANMIGGSVKALVPGPSALSLPHVHVDEAASDDVAGRSICFECSGRHFTVTVTQHNQESGS